MSQLKLNINGIDYTSIGEYMDNHDAIGHYFPDSKNVNDWISFLESAEPIIALWSFGFFQDSFHDDFDSEIESVGKRILKAGEVKLVLFLKKYYWGSVLNDMFIDFIFGPYSEYGDDMFPKIICNDNIIEQECFDYGDHVFIESRRYVEFIKDLKTLIEYITQNLKNN